MARCDHESPFPAKTVSRCYPKHVKPLRKLKSFRGNYEGPRREPGQPATSKLPRHLESGIEKIFKLRQFQFSHREKPLLVWPAARSIFLARLPLNMLDFESGTEKRCEFGVSTFNDISITSDAQSIAELGAVFSVPFHPQYFGAKVNREWTCLV